MRDWQKENYERRMKGTAWNRPYSTVAPKEKQGKTNKGYCKAVSREVFEDALYRFTQGEIPHSKACELCGLSAPTFNLRANQYLNPKEYGELPPHFFGEDDDATVKTWSLHELLALWMRGKHGQP